MSWAEGEAGREGGEGSRGLWGERGGEKRGRGVGCSSRSAAGLDVLTALHLWFVLSGLHLDVDHVVTGGHVALLTLRHLLLRDDTVDLCRERDKRVKMTQTEPFRVTACLENAIQDGAAPTIRS